MVTNQEKLRSLLVCEVQFLDLIDADKADKSVVSLSSPASFVVFHPLPFPCFVFTHTSTTFPAQHSCITPFKPMSSVTYLHMALPNPGPMYHLTLSFFFF